MQDQTRSDVCQGTREAAELFRLARGISTSAGMERSFKITGAGVDAERFLISMAVRPGFGGALEDELAALSFPPDLRDPLRKCLRGSRFLHLGYEETRGEPTCKIYCEAPEAQGERVLMHTGFKWRPGSPREFSRDEYWRLGGGEDALRTEIAQTLEQNPALLTVMQGLLDLVLSRVAACDLFFLEVMRGGMRRSFDLRLYDAGLNLGDVGGFARAAAKALGAPGTDATIAAIVAAHARDRLGHVSAAPSFLTFYRGAEELA
jgi:hypothetical protein